MAVTVRPEPQAPPEVAEFLKCRGAEAAFQTVGQWVRNCFPQWCSIEVRLLDDPDEEDRRWVIFHVFLPAVYPPEQLRVQRLRYYEGLVNRLPFQDCHLFGLILDFNPR